MKISAVKVNLTSQDILEAVKEYLEVDGLNITDIILDNNILIKGTYKKGIKISFQITVSIERVNQDAVNINIMEIKAAGIHIFKKLKNFALASLLKDLKKYGLFVEKDIIILDMNVLCKYIPYVDFKLISLNCLKGQLEAEISDINVMLNKKISEEAQKIDSNVVKPINKVEDRYSELRNKVVRKIPEKYKDLLQYLMLLPDILILLGRLFKDTRVPRKIKIVVGVILAYFASPIDIALNFIPFIGPINDAAVAFYGLNFVMTKVPENVILENWQGNEDLILKVKEGITFLNNALGGNNISKLAMFLKKSGGNE